MSSIILRLGLPVGALLAVGEAYRWHRRRQLVLMPKGINDARGVTRRSAIKAARPTSYNR